MSMHLLSLLSLAFAGAVDATSVASVSKAPAELRMVSWWVDSDYKDSDDRLNAAVAGLGLTHLVVSPAEGEDPLSYDVSGNVSCNKSKARFQTFVQLGKAHNFKVMILGRASWRRLLNDSNYVATYWAAFVKTLGPAAEQCGAKGVEFDWEPGVEPSAADRTKLTSLLGDLNAATSADFDVSLDLMMWGVTGDDEPLNWRPAIDEKLLNAGRGPTFVNTESYHWPSLYSNIEDYKFDGKWLDFYGVDRSRVNIGMPLFSKPTKAHCAKFKNPAKDCNNTWHWLHTECPEIADDGINCYGDHVVSKDMALELGQWIAKEGWGGAFPWAVSFDALDSNLNASLVARLAKGMRGTSPWNVFV